SDGSEPLRPEQSRLPRHERQDRPRQAGQGRAPQIALWALDPSRRRQGRQSGRLFPAVRPAQGEVTGVLARSSAVRTIWANSWGRKGLAMKPRMVLSSNGVSWSEE